MTSETSSGSHCARSRMLRRRAQEEDSTVLIDVSPPEAEKRGSYGSTAHASEPGGQQAAACRAGSPAKPRIADFVLVWEEDLKLDRQQDSAARDRTDMHRTWRETFLDNLRAAGLCVDQALTEPWVPTAGRPGREHHSALRPPQRLLGCALLLRRRPAPEAALAGVTQPGLQLVGRPAGMAGHPQRPAGGCARRTPRVLLLPVQSEQAATLPPNLLHCSHAHSFLGSDNQDTFFTSTKRHQILFEILAKTPYGHEKKNLLGIHQLLAEGVLSAAFPLHDGPFKTPPEGPQAPRLNQRQVLFQHWARWGKWNKYQPLDHVRRYFGEKVALYFAWLGFYTGWLLPAAVVGTLVFLVGCFLVFSDIPTQELCGSKDSFEMCPLCLDCPFWLLSSACALAQVREEAGRLFDHGGTVFFSLFMALWAVLLLEYWKRKSATLAYRWDCSDYEDTEERPRPQFAASAPMTAPNPITGEDEPYFPERSRARRMLAGSVVIVVMVAVVVMCLVSIILYRAIMAIVVSRSGNTLLAAWASRIASLTGSVVNLVFILILSKIYVSLAHVLTRWEMHRTQTKFEDAFTLKVFIFQFVNFYSSPVYIAFFKGRFVGYPGNYHTLFGVRNEECAAGGCLIELAQELLVIMVGKQVINNMQEVLIPAAVRLRHHLRGRLSARAALRPAQQLGGDPLGRAQVRLRVPAPGGRAHPGHRHLVPHPGGPHAPGGHQQRLPPGLLVRLPAARLLPVDPRPRPARLPQLHAGASPVLLRRRAQPHVQCSRTSRRQNSSDTGLKKEEVFLFGRGRRQTRVFRAELAEKEILSPLKGLQL
ncbi:anoctamin-7 isoform X15 [Homo sapiens]|uniref:anoctamin-7 isoform X15 n=1 Tax=Homo sapiens TaxID=9606 RepID=UPI0023DE9F5B|nr:anoctamin-7 isoform X15 [Homo sapiens]XP_054198323.1 anoctamin-7 isoform X15 [Homo sapiens]